MVHAQLFLSKYCSVLMSIFLSSFVIRLYVAYIFIGLWKVWVSSGVFLRFERYFGVLGCFDGFYRVRVLGCAEVFERFANGGLEAPPIWKPECVWFMILYFKILRFAEYGLRVDVLVLRGAGFRCFRGLEFMGLGFCGFGGLGFRLVRFMGRVEGLRFEALAQTSCPKGVVTLCSAAGAYSKVSTKQAWYQKVVQRVQLQSKNIQKSSNRQHTITSRHAK